MSLRLSASVLALATALAACTQGSEIASPGPTSPGTGTGGGGGGGGGGGTGGGTASCPSGFAQDANATGGLTTCAISGAILADLTLPFVSGVAYRLNGRVDVGTDVANGGQGATLTIEPGVTVYGESGDDYLVVNRGSQIDADGTLSSPIVFTSADDLERQADADPSNDDGGSNIEEWGGLVILGEAPTNECFPDNPAIAGTAACSNVVEGVTNPDALYGGGDSFDSSGTLRYVQVRFAGNPINTQGNELNGITFAGVGAGTTVEFIQVHNNSDDGVEFFGGNVNVRYLVLTGNDDDSIDTDNGYQGNIQFAVVVQRDDGGNNIVEASGGGGVAPFSNPAISNFTFIGTDPATNNDAGNAFRVNTATRGLFVNGIVNSQTACIRWDDSAGDGIAGFTAGSDPAWDSVLFDCTPTGASGSGREPASADAAVAAGANNVIGLSSLASVLFPGANEGLVNRFDETSIDPFFQDVDYIGAFSPTETETANWAAGWTFALFPEPTCPTGTIDSGSSRADLDGEIRNVCLVDGSATTADISSDIRLTRGNIYRLDGRVDVGADVGATGTAAGGQAASLTIESGVTVYGESGDDYIVVNRGSQIFVNGTQTNPVVFTSGDDLLNPNRDDTDIIEEWGGLVILGRAPTNECFPDNPAIAGTAACSNVVEGVTNPDALYGGDQEDDNSGTLRFLQLRYAGNPINTQGNELNGITFAGVGDGTTVEFIQVHNNSDDGVEFFGGDVNVRYLVLTGNDDDSIDTDNGYDGNIQFALVIQRANGGNNIVEASGGGGVAPFSNPAISNFTFIGTDPATNNDAGNAFRVNTATRGLFVNGVVDTQTACIRWDDSAGDGIAGFTAGSDPAWDSVLFDCTPTGASGSGREPASADAAVAAGANNDTTTGSSLTGTFVNGGNETGVTVFDVTTLDSWFLPVTYVGAVQNSADRWWAGWSCGLETGSSC